MRTLRYVALLLGALPVLLFFGMLAGSRLTAPDFEVVDPADPPIDLAVLGAWQGPGDEFVCRAFYLRDLRAHSDSIPALRYTVSEPELEICRGAFQAFGRDAGWNHEFEWERASWRARVARPDPDEPNLFVVSYWSDEDRVADTRYRLDPLTAEPSDFEFRGSFGPAQGISVLVVGGGLGVSAWLLLLAYLAVRWLRLRRNEPPIEAMRR